MTSWNVPPSSISAGPPPPSGAATTPTISASRHIPAASSRASTRIPTSPPPQPPLPGDRPFAFPRLALPVAPAGKRPGEDPRRELPAMLLSMLPLSLARDPVGESRWAGRGYRGELPSSFRGIAEPNGPAAQRGKVKAQPATSAQAFKAHAGVVLTMSERAIRPAATLLLSSAFLLGIQSRDPRGAGHWPCRACRRWRARAG